MKKKPTTTMDDRAYNGVRSIVRRRRSQFIESLSRADVHGKDLEVAYHQMAREVRREAEAIEWAEATLGDMADVDMRAVQ